MAIPPEPVDVMFAAADFFGADIEDVRDQSCTLRAAAQARNVATSLIYEHFEVTPEQVSRIVGTDPELRIDDKLKRGGEHDGRSAVWDLAKLYAARGTYRGPL